MAETKWDRSIIDYRRTRLEVVWRRGRTVRTRGRRRVLQALHWASCTPSTCSRHDCRVRGDTSQGAVALREGRCRGRVWRHADDVRGRAWHLDAASRLVELVFESYHLHFVECCILHVRCMQAKLTLKVAGAAECRGRHDDLQLADQVLYGSIAGDAQRRKRGRSLLLRVVVSWRR